MPTIGFWSINSRPAGLGSWSFRQTLVTSLLASNIRSKSLQTFYTSKNFLLKDKGQQRRRYDIWLLWYVIIQPTNLEILWTSRIKIYLFPCLSLYSYFGGDCKQDWTWLVWGHSLGDVLLPSKLLPFLLKGPDPADSAHVNNLWEIGPNKNLSSRNKCSLSSETAINAHGEQRLPDKVTSAAPETPASLSPVTTTLHNHEANT